jgi:hypothetical protein
MDTEQDLWFPLAVLVAVIAVFMWAASSVSHSDSGWVPWLAGAVIVVAIGSVAVRAWLSAKGVIPTQQSQDKKQLAIQLESVRSVWQVTHTALLLSGAVGLQLLVQNGWIPGWVAAVLTLVLLAVWIWLGWRFRRRTA